jgi:hypothetical protein
MSVRSWRMSGLAMGALTLLSSAVMGAGFEWQVVVNNGFPVPGDGRTFNSYNQPSLNLRGLVVFRARSRGGTGGEPAHGVFARDMSVGGPLRSIFGRETTVPHPNNLGTTFVEPPSFPRIDIWSDTIASRGNHEPVWEYDITPKTTTKAGTTGIYTNPFGNLITGASNLGAVPEFPFFAVPGTYAIKFDVFPGAPAVTDGATLVFKGNHSVPNPSSGGLISKTGVYCRNLTDAPAGGILPVTLIADTATRIPGTTALFGSVAPPSAVGRAVVFAGFDNEQRPTKGGLYLASLDGPSRALTTLVRIGGPVPGETRGAFFNKLGEAVSFDGRFVAFWGAWGFETRTLILRCEEEGNRDRVEYCQQMYPDGFQTRVPLRQGIFVADTRTGQVWTVAKTGIDFDDFVYWNFSGRVPGAGDDTGEAARWRSSSFVAVSGLADGRLTDGTFHAAFKARTGEVVDGTYVDPIDGIYLRKGERLGTAAIATVVETGMDGTRIDPEAVDPLTLGHLPVTSMGIERDGFRGDSLVVNVSMGTEEAGWAGIYLTHVPEGF